VGPHTGSDEVERAYAAALERLPSKRLERVIWWLRGCSAADLREARDTLADPERRRRYDENVREA